MYTAFPYQKIKLHYGFYAVTDSEISIQQVFTSFNKYNKINKFSGRQLKIVF